VFEKERHDMSFGLAKSVGADGKAKEEVGANVFD